MVTRKAWLLRPAQGLLGGQSVGCPLSHLLLWLEAPKHPVHRCPGLKTPAEPWAAPMSFQAQEVSGATTVVSPCLLWSSPWHGPRAASTTIVAHATLC